MHAEPGVDTEVRQPDATVTNSTFELSPREENGLTDTVMRTMVSTGNDALNLLFRAAER